MSDRVASGFSLVAGERRLELRRKGERRGIDLDLGLIARKARGGRKIALARACDVSTGMSVLDALAGWGVDGLVLARLGCKVTMVESNPTVFAMLSDFTDRFTAERMGEASCRLGDGTDAFAEGFDVIYLDPMFDVHPTGALPDKRMQYLSQIVDRVMDEHELVELLDAARRHANNRVVLKRRARAPFIAVPDWQITAKTVRFDVYRPLSRTVAVPKPAGQRSPPTT